MWRQETVLHHAKRAAIDWFAALYPGTRMAPSPEIFASLGEEAGHGRASLVGFGSTAFAPSAAWLNGTASHAAELDDIYREGIFHPGSPVVAAALAVAEERDLSGADFLAAIAVGYEVSGRVGRAVQPDHISYFHATGTLGALGAAAAAASLLNAGDIGRIGHAIATAATFASGLQEAVRSEAMTKPIHAGHAAAVGVRAAYAAEKGVTGATGILDGATGFGAALSGERTDWSKALDTMGEAFVIANATHKVHACCGHLFPAIDAVLALRAEHALSPDLVSEVRVTTYQSALDATARFAPRTAYECKFSMPFVIGHAITFGHVGLDAFEPTKLEDAGLRALMAKCTLHSNDDMTAAFPQRRFAEVAISLTDGREIAGRTSVRKGDPEAPLSDADLEEKFRMLAGPVVGSTRAETLLGQLWALDDLRVRDLSLSKF